MEDIDELKKSRSSGKRSVNKLIRKLKAALQYGDENTSKLKEELEEEYDNLCDLDMQISELEKTDSNYLDDISNSYDDIIKLFYNSVKEDLEIKNKLVVADKRRNVDRYILEISEITDRLKVNLTIDPID